MTYDLRKLREPSRTSLISSWTKPTTLESLIRFLLLAFWLQKTLRCFWWYLLGSETFGSDPEELKNRTICFPAYLDALAKVVLTGPDVFEIGDHEPCVYSSYCHKAEKLTTSHSCQTTGRSSDLRILVARISVSRWYSRYQQVSKVSKWICKRLNWRIQNRHDLGICYIWFMLINILLPIAQIYEEKNEKRLSRKEQWWWHLCALFASCLSRSISPHNFLRLNPSSCDESARPEGADLPVQIDHIFRIYNQFLFCVN